MSRSRKMLRSLLIAACAAGLATYGTFSAFSATTQNDGNQIAAGTVNIAENLGGGFLYQVSNVGPGVTTEKCVQVTYSGSLDSNVKLYVPTAPATRTLDQYVNLQIDVGTAPAGAPLADCSDFDGSPTNVYTGTLKSFIDTETDFASGTAVTPKGEAFWSQNDRAVFRFRVTIADDNNAAGKSVTAHSFKWEAQNR
jgi:predicted ribosomally synthesized peptide with SipW-like signal peptide